MRDAVGRLRPRDAGRAGHRWPFEDASFDIVYSEHMFEHILPMDGSVFLREM